MDPAGVRRADDRRSGREDSHGGGDVSAQVRVERDGPIASIVLDNPPLNQFGEQVFTDLVACIDEVEAADEDGSRTFGQLLGPVRRLERLEVPTLALIHGLCLTAAWEVALGCDLIWMAESAKSGLVETVVGLTPGAGGTQRMAERAGPSRAREFVYTGGLFDAATLERWGVVN